MTDILKTVSQKLQAGETLTPEEKGRAICEMLQIKAAKWSDGEYYYGVEGSHAVARAGQPFENTDDAIKFTQGLFSDFCITLDGPKDWECSIGRENLPERSWDVLASSASTTPSAAIMAACIEAFLTRKGR